MLCIIPTDEDASVSPHIKLAFIVACVDFVLLLVKINGRHSAQSVEACVEHACSFSWADVTYTLFVLFA